MTPSLPSKDSHSKETDERIQDPNRMWKARSQGSPRDPPQGPWAEQQEGVAVNRAGSWGLSRVWEGECLARTKARKEVLVKWRRKSQQFLLSLYLLGCGSTSRWLQASHGVPRAMKSVPGRRWQDNTLNSTISPTSGPCHLACPKGVASVSFRGWLWDVRARQGPGTWQTSKQLHKTRGTRWKLFMTLFLSLWEHDLLPSWPRISICLGGGKAMRLLQGTRGNSRFPTGVIGLGSKKLGFRSRTLSWDGFMDSLFPYLASFPPSPSSRLSEGRQGCAGRLATRCQTLTVIHIYVSQWKEPSSLSPQGLAALPEAWRRTERSWPPKSSRSPCSSDKPMLEKWLVWK